MMIKTIALTGGIGAGKTTVANLFAQLGIKIIDTDIIAKNLLSENLSIQQKVIAHFGEQIINPDNTINRRLLREFIFNNQAYKQWLENLLHPLILAEVNEQLAKVQSNYAIVVVPLLAESKLNWPFDRVLVIDAEETKQIERVKTRDQHDETFIQKIMANQSTRAERLKIADDVIMNNGDLENLKRQVHVLHVTYLKPLG